ncbi:MAG: IgGFc-binding protein [Myxococcota bacterium]|nr:IgGFc-binding protein [Myxococcota bacterium]
MRRHFASIPIAALVALSACTIESAPMLSPRDGGPPDAPYDAPPSDGGFSCVPDEPGCYGHVRYVCGDDGTTRVDEELCPGACDPAMGCVQCVPGTFRCDGDWSTVCDAQHQWRAVRDCSEWGSACGAAGLCEDACGAAEAARSNVGCEYWPVPLANTDELDQEAFDFRVVVTNPGRDLAEVTITRGGRFEARETVPPGAVAEIRLPWIDGVSFPFPVNEWESIVTENGAYRLTSTRPVIVSQFNPFHYASRGAHSYTNDASLLLPTHVLGDEYFATSYVPFSKAHGYEDYVQYGRYPGWIAVVGVSEEPASIEILVTGDTAADRGGRWSATPSGGTIRFTLARGEVAQIAAAVPPGCGTDRPGWHPFDADPLSRNGACREAQFDLTGSRITADRPISVFSGHTCADVPHTAGACDHLETQLAPVPTWGERFATTPMRDPGTSAPNLVRIVAARDDTTVTIDPPQRDHQGAMVSTVELDSGEHVELIIGAAIEIEGDQPIQVAQMMVGQHISDPPLERGDPALTVLVPEEQFRRTYVFVTPSSYTPVVNGQSYLLVSREPGDAITLDDREVTATWERVGDREVALVPVGGGTHRLSASEPVGLIAYGLGEYTSYAYPAGLDLRIIPF